jgi:ABC-type proline/glycine betaine transport system permease subunit
MSAPFRLRRKARKTVLLAHLVFALGWLGVDVVIAILAVAGFRADRPERIAAAYLALDAFAVPALLVFGVGALATGLLLSLGSGWGLLRYWWVAAKLGINLLLTTLVLVLLRPVVAEAATQVAQVDPTLRERLAGAGVDSDLLYPGFVSGAFLLLAAILAVFKPWGRTPWAKGRAGGTHENERIEAHA